MDQHSAIAAGRVAVITGAASGIGLAAAKKLGAAGMRLVMADIDKDQLNRVAEELRGQCPRSRTDSSVIG